MQCIIKYKGFEWFFFRSVAPLDILFVAVEIIDGCLELN